MRENLGDPRLAHVPTHTEVHVRIEVGLSKKLVHLTVDSVHLDLTGENAMQLAEALIRAAGLVAPEHGLLGAGRAPK